MKNFIRNIKALFIFGALSLAATESSATILLAANSPGNVNGAVATDLDLNGAVAGGTPLSFITPIAENVVITFNAECATGGTEAQWTSVEIIVDPAGATGPTVVAPTSTLRAFCTGNATASVDGWVSATAQAVIRVPAGVHRVSVRATNSGGSASWWIGDSSIVVSDQ